MIRITLGILVFIFLVKLLIALFIGQDLVLEWVVFSSGRRRIRIIILLDFISIIFLFTVCLISLRVSVFSNSYIISEKYFRRFIFLVLLFIIRIFLLILRPNLISLLLGWDGLGVTSYLLVIFYQRPKSYNAGIITAITNRLGDVGILLTIRLLLFKGSWSFFSYWWEIDTIFQLIILILILASITKRAQIPFSAWLPAAMAAPTPVSALVHSSTLVTAGVYLIIRFNFILLRFPLLKYLRLIGGLTIIIAGIGAIFEIDIKKIIALSTLSQLGVMIIVIGAGYTLLGFFHLVSHAFFKAILFICAGNLIHNYKDYQDIRLMSSRITFLPFTISIFIVANFRLCGLPFIAGFYSKDLILEIILIRSLNNIIFLIIIVGTILTVIYSFRFIFLLTGSGNQWEGVYSIGDFDYQIFFRIFFLLTPAILAGLFLSWVFFYSPSFIFFPLKLKLIIPILILSGAVIIELWINNYLLSEKFNIFIFKWINRHIWFLPLVLRVRRTKLGLTYSKKSSIFIENGWVELILFSHVSKNFFKLRNFFEKIFLNIFSQSIFFIFILIILFTENLLV